MAIGDGAGLKMRGMSTRGGLVVALLLALATTARADDVAHARDAAKKAVQHYNLAEWQQALDSFTEAYRAHEDPAFLFNIGQCHRQLGHVQEAITFYRSYLRNLPNAENRVEVRELISKLEATAAAESATKKAPPQEPRPPSGAVATTPAPPLPAPAATTPTTATTPGSTPATRFEDRGRSLRLAGIAVGAVGVAALVTGGALVGVAQSDADKLNSPSTGAIYDAGRDDRAHAMWGSGIALIAVGGAAVVGGVALFVVGHRRAHTVAEGGARWARAY